MVTEHHLKNIYAQQAYTQGPYIPQSIPQSIHPPDIHYSFSVRHPPIPQSFCTLSSTRPFNQKPTHLSPR